MVTLNRRELLAGALGTGLAAATRFGLPGLGPTDHGLTDHGLTGHGLTGHGLAASPDATARLTAETGRATVAPGPLVLCTLLGGNDGLNTVVPYETGQYVDWRADLAIPASQALPIGSFDGVDLGLHPSLTGLHSLFGAGQVAVVCGVEYPNPNFSHFASTSIWETADPTGDTYTGWLGRWLDAAHADPLRALGIGPTLQQTLIGAHSQASTLMDDTTGAHQLPGKITEPNFITAYEQIMTGGSGLDTLQRAVGGAGIDMLTVGHAADAALDAEKPPTDPAGRNSGDIGNQLAIVAECIRYGLPTEAYNVTFGSFDTHAAQAATHAALLSQLDAAIAAFMTDFRAATAGQSPVLVVYSEFGRTPRVNGSDGTDHSSPSVVLVIGPGVKGGFYGAVPSFTNLDVYGNQIFTTDFRAVYATILEEVLGTDSTDILGRSFPTLGFL